MLRKKGVVTQLAWKESGSKETNLDVAQAFIDPSEMPSSLGHPETDLQIKAKNGIQCFYLGFHA